jgi:2-dehydropantoate 2-reductase
MIIGPVSGFDNAESANKLMELLLSTPALVPSKVPSSELLRIQLRKLVVNAVINPLTVVFDCYNGEIFKPERDPLIEKLVAEISAVTRRILLEDNPEADLEEFSSQRLEEVVRDIGAKTATNISSMRQDVLAGRETEIDYINGYVVRRAKEFDIACDCNEQVVQFVKTAELQQDKGLSRNTR